tara:strand:- start:7759 stop:8157 length:399 start_codon:yes stop_codon:yes gene_type:complete
MMPIEEIRQTRSFLDSKQKIKAIKHVRDNGIVVGSETRERVSLKYSKWAVDNMQGHGLTGAEIVPNWHVHALIVSGPACEKIEVDLETLQMHFLTSLETLGLAEVARLTDLVEYIKQWQVGQENQQKSDEAE